MDKTFWKGKRVLVTGGAGFLGSHLCDILKDLNVEPFVPRSYDYDLRYPLDVARLFETVGKIDVLFNLAANVGGIGYNRQHPYQLFYDNIKMGVNLIHGAIKNDVGKLVQVGTVCGYPKHCRPPFIEETFWDGYPEETNAPYGLAKKMLLVQLQAARAEYGFEGVYLVPTNLYGPGDEFNPARSHVIPALIRKVVEAKRRKEGTITVWGSGTASRDFLYVKDAARALVLTAEQYQRPEPLNLGSGREMRIVGLLSLIMDAVDYHPNVVWDNSKPDGQPRRKLNSNAAHRALGWSASTTLKDGLRETVAWFEDALDHGLVYNDLEVQLA